MVKKNFFIITLLLFKGTLIFADPGDIVTISRIRIVIDDSIYIWDIKEDIPDKDERGFTSPATIISFVCLAPGDRLAVAVLEREVKTTETRLFDCGYFYNISVDIVPPRRYQNRRTILIKLREGFLYRFGGDNLYAVFGVDNLWGKKKRFRLYAGYNMDGAEYIDEAFAGTNIILGGGVYYKNPGLGISENNFYHMLTLSGTIGLRFHPDWILGLSVEGNYITFPDDDSQADVLDSVLRPKLSGRIIIGGIETPSAVQFGVFPNIIFLHISEDVLFSFSARASANWFLVPGHSVNLQLSGGGSWSELPRRYDFDLAHTADRGIRSGYTDESLTGEKFVLVNIEYRFIVYEFLIPPMFNIEMAGFIYTDLGFIEDFENRLFESGLKDAYGLGLRLIFNNPVFAYFSFSYGWNREGSGRFVFAVTGGF
jgi:hypothetical protein